MRCPRNSAAALLLALLTLFAADARRAHADVSASSATSSAHGDEVRPSTTGFYPIWENTGFVEKHREIYLGTNGAHFGILDRAHIGVQPIHFLYRAPNGYAKFSLLDRGRWHLSAQAGALYLMNEASRAFLSPMYASRLDNPDFAVLLTPVTASATHEVSDWMQLHQSATLLGVISANGTPLANEAYLGYTVVGELLAKRRHSVRLHASEVGFWKHDFAMLGTSYRYHNSWFEFQMGYFYRFRAVGNQSSPMIALGFLM